MAPTLSTLLLVLVLAPPEAAEDAPHAEDESHPEHEHGGDDDDDDDDFARHVEVQTEVRFPTMSSSWKLDAAALERHRGEALADTLTDVPGVTVLRAGGRLGKPIIRGQVGRRNLFLVDGIRLQTQKWGDDHAPEIDPYAAGSITVVKGAATTRFGPDAIGGAVLVDPPPMRFRPGVSASIGTVGYSNPLGGGGFARVDMAHPKLKGLSWRVDGSISRHRAAIAPDYPLDNTGSFTWNAGTRLAYRHNRFEFTLSYRRLDATAGIFSGQRVSNPDEFEASTKLDRPVGAALYSADFEIERPRQEYSHDLASARAQIELADAGHLHVTYAFQLNRREEFERIRGTSPASQAAFDLSTHTGDVHFDQHMLRLTPTVGLVGVSGLDLSGQANEFESSNTLIPDYDQTFWGAYLVERLVHARWEIQAGGRYDGLYRVARLNDRDYLGQLGGNRLDEEACEQSSRDQAGGTCRLPFHTGSASLGAMVRPAASVPDLTMRFDLNSSARIPQIDEQFMNGSVPSFPILALGSSKIGVERTWGGTFTLAYASELLFAEASAFGSYVADYVYFAGAPQEGQCAPLTCTIRGPFPVYEFQAVDAAVAGGELAVQHKMPRLPFEVGGDAAWVRGYDVANDRPLSFMPADRYRLWGRFLWPDTRVSRAGNLGLELTMVDRPRLYDADVDFAAPPPGYVLLGASSEVEFPVSNTVFRLGLRGGNLTNTRYREYTNLLRYFADEPGWMVQLRLSVDIDFTPTRGEDRSSKVAAVTKKPRER